MKLTRAQKDEVRYWLEHEDPDEKCPFTVAGTAVECTDLCPHLFSRLDKLGKNREPHKAWCPCHVYTLAHVKRVARKVII